MQRPREKNSVPALERASSYMKLQYSSSVPLDQYVYCIKIWKIREKRIVYDNKS